jgi:hypothetical protein
MVEVWRKKPTYRLFHNKKRSFVAIFGQKFNIYIPKQIFRFMYKNNKFLVNSFFVMEKLKNFGFSSNVIKYIPNGTIGSNKKAVNKKNKILIICGKNVDDAIALVGLIERRSLDWKFVVLSDKKSVLKLKNAFKSSALVSSVKIIINSKSSFDTNIVNSKFLIINKDVKKRSSLISEAFIKNTPVILEGKDNDDLDKKTLDLVFSVDNKMDVASKILSFSKNENKYKKLQEKISKNNKNFTWEEVGEMSRVYIESL